MNAYQTNRQNINLLITSCCTVFAFAIFVLLLLLYIQRHTEQTAAPTLTVSKAPVKAPNKPIQAVRAAPPTQTPIKPAIGPITANTKPTAPPQPPPLIARPAPQPVDKALEAYCEKVTAYLNQCRVLNKLIGKSPSLSDYKREHEVASAMFVRIPEEVPTAIQPDQGKIISRGLADLDQLADIDAINIAQRDKCLLNAASCEENGNEQSAAKFRAVAGSCEESLLKNIDHRKKLMGFVEDALAEGKPE